MNTLNTIAFVVLSIYVILNFLNLWLHIERHCVKRELNKAANKLKLENMQETNIQIYEPVCLLKWSNGNRGTVFNVYRDFNWFQRKMLKICFGLDYEKVEEE